MIDEQKPEKWQCVSLTPEQEEFGFTDIIRAEMAEAWISRGLPADVGVWLQRDGAGTRIYFSPAAARVAPLLLIRFGGRPCSEPERENLDVLLGRTGPDEEC